MRAETGRAVLVATGHLATPTSGSSLAALAGRIATSRGLSTAQLLAVTSASPAWLKAELPPSVAEARPDAPEQGRRLRADADRAAPTAELVLIAAHGGAGVSSLLRCGLRQAGAVDGHCRWPAAGLVLLVARTSTAGLERVRGLAREQVSTSERTAAQVAGLVLVADAPGRLPRRVRGLADLVSGAFPRVWQVPWLEEWRLAAQDQPLPVHPEVARLLTDVRQLSAAPSRPIPSVGQGALL